MGVYRSSVFLSFCRCETKKATFLDAAGAVIAVGDEETQRICYEAGPRKGVCKEAPLVVTAPPETPAAPAPGGQAQPEGKLPLVPTVVCVFVCVCGGGVRHGGLGVGG